MGLFDPQPGSRVCAVSCPNCAAINPSTMFFHYDLRVWIANATKCMNCEANIPKSTMS